MSCSPSLNSGTWPRVCHSSRQRCRSFSTPAAVWYRSSAILASNFITIADTEAGTLLERSSGGVGFLAMWQWTHSIGSEAVKGRPPGQHFIKGDAEGVEIAPAVNTAIHT